MDKLGLIPERYRLTEEKKLLINQIISCCYTDRPDEYELHIENLKQIKFNAYYTEEEKEYLNTLRKLHLPHLKRKLEKMKDQYPNYPSPYA